MSEGRTVPDYPVERAQRLWDALARIAAYMSPERLRRESQKLYGLDGDESIEMAYENVLFEAKAAIKGVRRPGSPTRKAKPLPPSPRDGDPK